MGAMHIWNAMEVAEEARENGSSEIHSSSLTVDHYLSLPEMTPRIIDLCKDLFNKWSKLDSSHFFVETLSGGITNLLLKVSVREENGNVENIAVRLYGPNTEYVVNRERELQFSHVVSFLQAPLGENYAPLKLQYYDVIIKDMLTFHNQRTRAKTFLFKVIGYLSAAGFGAKLLGVFGNGMVQSFINARTPIPPDLRNPKLAAEIAKQLRRFHWVEIPGSKEPQLWNDIFKFFQKASTITFDDSEKQRKYETISFEELHSEVIELKGNSTSSILSMDHTVTEVLTLEVTSLHTLAMIVTTASTYPSKDEQYHFFRHYLESEKPDEVSEKVLEALYVETNTYMLASHLHWALWALIQAKMSPIDFDYLGYFFLGFNEYTKQKEKCLSLAQSYLSRSGTG